MQVYGIIESNEHTTKKGIIEMIKAKKISTVDFMALLLAAAIFALVYVCGMCWEYSLNTCLEIADSPYRIELWQGMLIAGIPVFGQVSIPFAIFTWIASLFFI
jgi:hypothetical protein